MKWALPYTKFEDRISEFVGVWPGRGDPMELQNRSVELKPSLREMPGEGLWRQAWDRQVGFSVIVGLEIIDLADMEQVAAVIYQSMRAPHKAAVSSIRTKFAPSATGKLKKVRSKRGMQDMDLPYIMVKCEGGDSCSIAVGMSVNKGPFVSRLLRAFPNEPGVLGLVEWIDSRADIEGWFLRGQNDASRRFARLRGDLAEVLNSIKPVFEQVVSLFDSSWTCSISVFGGPDQVLPFTKAFGDQVSLRHCESIWTNGEDAFKRRDEILGNPLFNGCEFLIPLGWTQLDGGGVWFLVEGTETERRGLAMSDGVSAAKVEQFLAELFGADEFVRLK